MKINRKKWAQVIIILLAIGFEKIFYHLAGIGGCYKNLGIASQALLSLMVILGTMHILSFLMYQIVKYVNPDFWLEIKGEKQND